MDYLSQIMGAPQGAFERAMTGYAPQSVPQLPEGMMPNPSAPVIRNDQQGGLFGGLGFQPMSQEGLAGLGIRNPFAMEFRTPRYDQPFTPFGMHTMDPLGYQQQFPAVDTQTQQPPAPQTPAPQQPQQPQWTPQTAYEELQRKGLFSIAGGGQGHGMEPLRPGIGGLAQLFAMNNDQVGNIMDRYKNMNLL